MTSRATFLHITDPHVSEAGVGFDRDDRKVDIPGVIAGTRETVLTLLFRRLAERLDLEKRMLDGVLFSGDAQHRGDPGGHEFVLKLLTEHLAPFGITADRIVATPGNHDVPRDSPPSSSERYEGFMRVWRHGGCVVPWLDGIDPWPAVLASDRHRLVGPESSWAIFPINTSNWSHVSSELPKPLGDVWDRIPEAVAPTDPDLAEQLRSQLQALARYDMARVSEDQLEVMRAIVATTPKPSHGRQLRIALMHHHLRSPSLREELKPFADMSNLEQVRAFLRGSGIAVVLHGHKHEHAAYFDHIYAADSEDMHGPLSSRGGTFDIGREMDAARLITVTGLPHTPEVTIEPIPLPRSGAEWPRLKPTVRRLWATTVRPAEAVIVAPGAPVTVEGSDLDEVYSRARAVARDDARRGMLVVHLDLPDEEVDALPLPSTYEGPNDLAEDERAGWLRELVEW